MSDVVVKDLAAHEKPGQQADGTLEVTSPGTQLAARRQELHWSIEYVANQLNLAPRQIQAIETDNYGALPGIASVRGFVRSYAKLLKIDPVPLLQVIAKEAARSEEMPLRRALPATPFADNRLTSPSASRMPSKLIVAIFLAVLAGGVILTVHYMGWMPQLGSFKPGSNAAVPAQNATSAAAPAAADARNVDSGNIIDPAVANPVVMNGANGSSGAQPAQEVPAAVAAMQPAAAANDTVSVTANAAADTANMLVLKLREDSWIEITRENDSTPLSRRLLKAGSTEAFKITEPVSITIGNAAGVDATLRGTPLELQAQAKNNVARLNLK